MIPQPSRPSHSSGQVGLDREDLVGGDVHHLGVAADVAGRADGLRRSGGSATCGQIPPRSKRLRALARLAGRSSRSRRRTPRCPGTIARSPTSTCSTPAPTSTNLTHRRVAEDRRRDLSELAAPVDDVGRAERGRAGAEKHAAGRRVVVLDVLDDERPVELGQERSPHPPLLPSAGSGRNGFAAPAPPSTG